jgi:hypothetical protein
MADIKTVTITRLSRTTGVDMNADVPTLNELYTVPFGKKCIIDSVVIHSNNASLAGMNDVDFGAGAAAITPAWLNNETGIGDMTTVNSWMVLRADSDDYVMIDGDDATAADRTFSMYTVSGSTGAATATIDVFGYLI